MRNRLYASTLNLLSIAFIIIVIGKLVIIAQSSITGEWKADARPDKAGREGKIHLNLSRTTNGEHKNQHGSSFEYSELQGLTREQALNGRVSFRLVREAGTITFDGSFTDGKGSGTFRFDPDSGYVNAMRSRGFDFEKSRNDHGEGVESRLLSAALINVTTALADDLRSSGFENLDVDDLFKAAIFKVDSKFMAEMKATGYPNLKMEELVKARIFKIDADFVRKLAEMGLATNDFEQVVKFSIFKVTPEYLAEMRAAGFDKLSPEEIVKFRIFKVTPELLTDLKAEGFGNLSSEEVVKFRIFNIDKETIRRAKAENPNVTVQELVEMKIGVKKFKNTY